MAVCINADKNPLLSQDGKAIETQYQIYWKISSDALMEGGGGVRMQNFSKIVRKLVMVEDTWHSIYYIAFNSSKNHMLESSKCHMTELDSRLGIYMDFC